MGKNVSYMWIFVSVNLTNFDTKELQRSDHFSHVFQEQMSPETADCRQSHLQLWCINREQHKHIQFNLPCSYVYPLLLYDWKMKLNLSRGTCVSVRCRFSVSNGWKAVCLHIHVYILYVNCERCIYIILWFIFNSFAYVHRHNDR